MNNEKLDRVFVKMEKRGLTALLTGKELELYEEFLARPIEYQNRIRQIEESESARLIVLTLLDQEEEERKDAICLMGNKLNP